MADSAIVKYSYTGHETFPFRYSWPTKGVRFLEQHPDLFTRDDAIVVLGVGKNMVGSIRHWCDTLGLIERADRLGQMRTTAFGRDLLGSGGWDPYLENPGTLWLLHWRLVSRRDRASTWYLAFTQWHTEAFSRDKLVDWLWRTAQETTSSATINSIQRDVDVFVRSYVPAPAARRDVPSEDSFDCPLVELALLREVEHGLYQFVRGPKPTLPQDIFVFALLDFWLKNAPNQQTLSFETILHGPGSPGAAFKLSENALAERLESLPDWSHLRYDETAGMRQVLRQQEVPPPEPYDVLKRYYGNPVALVGAHNA